MRERNAAWFLLARFEHVDPKKLGSIVFFLAASSRAQHEGDGECENATPYDLFNLSKYTVEEKPSPLCAG